MPKVTFILTDTQTKQVEAEPGFSIMEIAHQNGIYEIEGACGGCLSCGTCHVYVHPDWYAKTFVDNVERSEAEEDMLDTAFDVQALSRLSCQILFSEALDGLIVALPGTHPSW